MLDYECPEPRVILRGLHDVFCLFADMDDPERPGQRVFVSNAELIFLKEIKYVQKGLLSDLPGVKMYREVGKLVTGFKLHRGRRNSSALEGMHLHLRFSQHPGASHTGPITAAARAMLFDLNWNVRAQVAAGLMVNIGHSWVWVVGALFDVVHVNNLPPDCIPPLFRAWARTETRFDPLLKWGVQFDALGLQGSGGALPSPPHTGDDISKALATHASAEMLARRDVAAFERATGLATEVRHVDELADRVGKRSRARAALTEHGADEVRARLQTGSSGPAPAPLRGLLPSFNLGHIGPTPLCGTVGRLVLDAASTTIFAMELDAPSEFSGTILLARGRRKDCEYLLL
jgi:hypothetical protein